MYTHLSEDEHTAARAGRLEIQCIRMQLTPKHNGSEFRGAGLLRQSTTNRLEFTLYDPSYSDNAGDFGRRLSQIGQFLDAQDLYDLKATDLNGRVWSATGIYPNPSGSLKNEGAVVQGSLGSLTCRFETESQEDSLQLYFPGDIRIPTNESTTTLTNVAKRKGRSWRSNVWVLDGPSYDLVATCESKGLEVRVSDRGRQLGSRSDTRIEEALWFVTGLPVRWMTLREVRAGRGRIAVRTAASEPPWPRLPPPVLNDWDRHALHTSTLFVLYLDHVRYFEESQFHPLSVAIRDVLRASSSNVHDEALVLAVSVESVVRMYFFEEGETADKEVADLTKVLNYLDSWEGPSRMKKRIKGAISQLKGTNPRNALRKLAADGIVTLDDVKAWEIVRNKTTHGQVADIEYAALVELCNRIHRLLIRLIAHIIGYAGALSFYGHKKPLLEQFP